MHRQSLGSPASKLLHAHGGVVIVGGRDDSAVVAAEIMAAKDQPEDEQLRKSMCCRADDEKKYIHLIPLLTFICFFILYLSSHNPSPTDLAQFRGFEGFSKPIESELQRVLEIGKGDVLAIRSSRNLQEIERQHSKNRLHRKFAGV